MNTERNCQSCKYYKDGYCENLELKPCYPQKGCDDFSEVKKINIEISNEQIEQMIKEAVNERVKTWFGEPKNKYSIRDAIIKAVDVEVSKRVDDSMIDIPKLASSLASKELAEKIIDNIGYNIAAIFAEKYGD